MWKQRNEKLLAKTSQSLWAKGHEATFKDVAEDKKLIHCILSEVIWNSTVVNATLNCWITLVDQSSWYKNSFYLCSLFVHRLNKLDVFGVPWIVCVYEDNNGTNTSVGLNQGPTLGFQRVCMHSDPAVLWFYSGFQDVSLVFRPTGHFGCFCMVPVWLGLWV